LSYSCTLEAKHLPYYKYNYYFAAVSEKMVKLRCFVKKSMILEKIDSPEDLRKLELCRLPQLCAEIREYMIECCSGNPGHLGSSLGAVELAVALHYVYDTPADKLVWDVGHQAYAHKILTGRREAFLGNRKLDGISGFPKMSESNYDAFGAGHASTSISAALGMASAAQLKGEHIHAVAVIGDGAMTGGLAFEGLNNAGALHSDILVVLNDNQIAIDKAVGALHNYLLRMSTSKTYNHMKLKIWDRLGNVKVRRFIQKLVKSMKVAFFRQSTLFQALGFRYFGVVDGNDVEQLVQMLLKIKELPGPKLLHVRTIKGKGYTPAESDPSVWHAPGKFNVETGCRIKSSDTRKKYQDIFGRTITELAAEKSSIVGVTPAMASGSSLDVMMAAFPDRVFDVGIEEEHAVTFCAGMAAQGLLPFCCIYSTFLQRAYDNIIHDVALQNLKVIFCIDRAGIVGEDGATHHGAFDLGYLRVVPGISIMAPMDEMELRAMLHSAVSEIYSGPVAIRYPRGACMGYDMDWNSKPELVEPGKARYVKRGSSNVAVLSIGTAGNLVASALADMDVTHCDMRFLKPLDEDMLRDVCAGHDTIITVEDGSVVGGLHGAVSQWICSNSVPCRIIGMGIPDSFVEQGTVEQLISKCGYSSADIRRAVQEMQKNK